MKIQPELTEREWLLLSAYLDHQLSAREMRQVEELLQTKPASREALEGLRRTRQVLRHTPLRKVPHNFTLAREMIRKPFLPAFSRVLSFSSALAGLLLVVVFAFDLSSGFNAAPLASRMAEPAADETFALQADKAGTAEPPIIFNWGPSSSSMGAYGKGGGGEGPAMNQGSGWGIGGGAPQAEAAVPQEEEEVPLEEAAPLEGLLQEQPETSEETQAMPEMLQAQPGQESQAEQAAPPAEAAAPETLSGTGPILGIRPAEEQGTITGGSQVRSEQAAQKSMDFLRLAEIFLGITTLLTAIAALVFRRKK